VPGTGITKSALVVKAVVPGIDEPEFLHAAETAKESCPVSQALASVPEISVEATLS
jgi:osmotically inducible protein OsmC